MDQQHTGRARAHWNQAHAQPELEAHDNIFSHPLIQAYASMRAFGGLYGQLDAVAVALRERTRPGEEVLSIGCGRAQKERTLARLLPDRRFVGIDIADEILALARAEIAAEGIANLRLELGDFNRLQLAKARFGAVLGLGAIHHVEALEDFWAQCRIGLRPGASILAQEYVGPDRFQWTDAQLREGNRVLRDIVPAGHHVHHGTVERIPVAHMLATDPSEAVRSSAILATCRDGGFDVTAVVGIGCALLQPVLMHQVSTFDPANWQHNLVLARLFAEEDRLLREGVLGHDFAMFVAVRKD
jgi:SAM-dependent methyltransferase